MKLALCFLLLAAPAAAEFTDPEKIQLQKLVGASVAITSAQEDAGLSIRDLPNEKMGHVAVLKELLDAGLACYNAMNEATGADVGGTREQQVSRLFSRIDTIQREVAAAQAALAAMPASPNVERAKKHLGEVALADFDRALAYASPPPSSFPRVVGPHGRFAFAESSIEHATQYVYHALFDMWNWWRFTDAPADENAKDMFAKHGRAAMGMFRAWGMDLGIVLSDDHQTILADMAAASGARPYDFHRLLLQIEYIFARPGWAHFSGREIKPGATGFIRQFGDAFTAAEVNLANLNPAQHADQWKTRRGSLSNTGETGWAAEFHFDFQDFWVAMDHWGAAVMLFFDAPPGPSPGITCGPGTVRTGNVCLPE